MHPFLKLSLGFFAVVLLGILDIERGLPGPSPVELEAKLRADGLSALNEAGHDWADIRMEGQKAVLTGIAPTEDALREARSVVSRSVSIGGPVTGGITAVDIREADIMPLSPSVIDARRAPAGGGRP